MRIPLRLGLVLHEIGLRGLRKHRNYSRVAAHHTEKPKSCTHEDIWLCILQDCATDSNFALDKTVKTTLAFLVAIKNAFAILRGLCDSEPFCRSSEVTILLLIFRLLEDDVCSGSFAWLICCSGGMFAFRKESLYRVMIAARLRSAGYASPLHGSTVLLRMIRMWLSKSLGLLNVTSYLASDHLRREVK